MDEVFGIVAAEFGFVGGERARDGFDFAEGDGDVGAEELIDAAGEGEGPAAVNEAALDGDFEGGGGCGRGGLGAELVVPVGAELRAPDARGARAAARVVRAEGEGGELADAQAGGAGVEREFHPRKRLRLTRWVRRRLGPSGGARVWRGRRARRRRRWRRRGRPQNTHGR